MSDKSHQWWKEYAFSILHTGSQVICNPPPTEATDDDWLLLLEPKLVAPLEEALASKGFTIGGSMSVIKAKRPHPLNYVVYDQWLAAVQRWERNQQRNNEASSLEPLEQFPDFDLKSNSRKNGIFRSWKDQGSLCTNLILTCSEEYFSNFSKATALAQRLNLLVKDDRIAVFEAVIFDRWPKISERKWSQITVGSFISTSPGAVNFIDTTQWGNTVQTNLSAQEVINLSATEVPTLSMDEQF